MKFRFATYPTDAALMAGTFQIMDVQKKREDPFKIV